MTFRPTRSRRPLRTLALAVTTVALTLGATPAEAAKKSPTQVRKWSTSTQIVTPGSTAKVTVKVVSRGKPSKRRMVILQRYAGGKWVRAAHQRSTRFGNATLRYNVGSKTGVTHRLRIKVNATRKAKVRITRARKVLVRASTSSATARRILQLTNEARAVSRTCDDTTFPARGRLTLNSRLNSAAQSHARDMASANYFSHIGRDGSTVGDRVTRAGYAWRAVGENIAAGQRSAEEVVRGWLESPGHCKNIMSGAYTQLGVGFSTNTAARYQTYWVQNFAAPR